jgi:hypothetical protein
VTVYFTIPKSALANEAEAFTQQSQQHQPYQQKLSGLRSNIDNLNRGNPEGPNSGGDDLPSFCEPEASGRTMK